MEKPLKKTVHYYPFGLKHKGYNTMVSSNGNSVAQRKKFGGFEFQDELGLQWYDMTARNYQPDLGRWMNLDPLAEQGRRHSPYNYAFDNPVYFIDPDGMWPFPNPIKRIGDGIARSFERMVDNVKEAVVDVVTTTVSATNTVVEGIANILEPEAGTVFTGEDGTPSGNYAKPGQKVDYQDGDAIMDMASYKGPKKGSGGKNNNPDRAKKKSPLSDAKKELKLFQEGKSAAEHIERTANDVADFVGSIGTTSTSDDATTGTTSVVVHDPKMITTVYGTAFVSQKNINLKRIEVPNNKSKIDSVKALYEKKLDSVKKEVRNYNGG